MLSGPHPPELHRWQKWRTRQSDRASTPDSRQSGSNVHGSTGDTLIRCIESIVSEMTYAVLAKGSCRPTRDRACTPRTPAQSTEYCLRPRDPLGSFSG